MLEQSAGEQWSVLVDECRAGVYVASLLLVPERDILRLKSRDEWCYICQLTGPPG